MRLAATSEGTSAYAKRHPDAAFRAVNGLHWSTIGIGTYLGGVDEETDKLVEGAVRTSLNSGINVVDCAANYRRGRAETSVGAALAQSIAAGDVTREEVIVCTKAGYLPTSGEEFLETYEGYEGITANDMVASNHCLHPSYLTDRVNKSLEALGVEHIDAFYVHNPEAHLAHVERSEFDSRLQAAFEAMEQAVTDGKIGCYGIATWPALRSSPTDRAYISIAGAKALAKRAAGGRDDHFKIVQLPLSLSMPEAINRPTQWIGDVTVPAVAAARLLGLTVVSSGSIGQAKIPEMNEALNKWLGEDLGTDFQRALQFTRSATGLTTALVGMKKDDHVRDNLEVVKRKPMPRAAFELMFRRNSV